MQLKKNKNAKIDVVHRQFEFNEGAKINNEAVPEGAYVAPKSSYGNYCDKTTEARITRFLLKVVKRLNF